MLPDHPPPPTSPTQGLLGSRPLSAVSEPFSEGRDPSVVTASNWTMENSVRSSGPSVQTFNATWILRTSLGFYQGNRASLPLPSLELPAIPTSSPGGFGPTLSPYSTTVASSGFSHKSYDLNPASGWRSYFTHQHHPPKSITSGLVFFPCPKCWPFITPEPKIALCLSLSYAKTPLPVRQ